MKKKKITTITTTITGTTLPKNAKFQRKKRSIKKHTKQR